MSYPFGGHPNLATYIAWLMQDHQGQSNSGHSKDSKGQSHSLTKLTVPATGKSVVVVGMKQSENLAPSTIGYLDRRLGVKSPWFSVAPPDDE